MKKVLLSTIFICTLLNFSPAQAAGKLVAKTETVASGFAESNTEKVVNKAVKPPEARQQQTFDVISFTAPKGWQQQQNGGGQMASVVVMTNTTQYQNELVTFLNSLKWVKAGQNEAGNTTTPTTKGNPGKGSVVGLWCDNHLETSGYSNGFPQYTAGYFRREYLFKDDGTYVFRLKNWSVYSKEIRFAYEICLKYPLKLAILPCWKSKSI